MTTKHFANLQTGMAMSIAAISAVSCGHNKMNSNENRRLPNIIYIYADDLGYGELGCYGQTKIRTPHLDRIAAEGIRFTQHYTSCPVSAAARCMLLTGRHSGNSYIRNNYELGGFEDFAERGQMPLPENTETIGRMLQRAGYATGIVGKWGLGGPGSSGLPTKQGFDFFYGYLDQKQAHNYYPTHLWKNEAWDTLANAPFKVHQRLEQKDATPEAYQKFIGKEYSLDAMADEAMAFINDHREQPFFLYVPFTVPHVALQVPEESLKEYDGAFEEKPYNGDKGYAPTLRPFSTYAAMITRMDSKIGMIMEQLKELGLDEHTMVMFSSDNGTTFDVGGADATFFNSTAGLRGLKTDVYEGGIRMPFIARWPGHIKAGTVTDHVSAQYDVYATFKELSGEELPYKTDGISFLPTLFGEEDRQQKHEYLYWEFGAKGGQLAIRIGDLKGVKQNVAQHPEATWKIYDLSKDRSETVDISAQYPELPKRFDAIVASRTPAHISNWNFMDYKASDNYLKP